MAVGRVSGPDAVSPVLIPTAEMGPRERSNLIWTMHNYWLHYRHNMDQTMLRERLFPVLKASVNYLLRQLTTGTDGKLHLPEAISPEYPKPAPDTNYDHALLRWGCQTLLAIDKRLGWAPPGRALARHPGPAGALSGGRHRLPHRPRPAPGGLPPPLLPPADDVSLAPGHRETPAERALIEKSLAHWIGFEGALEGYSFVGASAISSLLGKGDDAHRYLGADPRFVKPNTMYLETGPVTETPLAAAQAVHDMLMQSWGDTLRIFPAVPAAWKQASFQDLRAQGAFLVSAALREGKTCFVRVTSLAGEPVTLQTAMRDPTIATPRPDAVVRASEGTFRLALSKGETMTLTEGGCPGRRRSGRWLRIQRRSTASGCPEAELRGG